jgi:hypothetical protein
LQQALLFELDEIKVNEYFKQQALLFELDEIKVNEYIGSKERYEERDFIARIDR